MMHALTELIKSDMKPALGVTEPGAIAFAVSTAKAHIKGTVKRVGLRLNSGMYKMPLPAAFREQVRWEIIMLLL